MRINVTKIDGNSVVGYTKLGTLEGELISSRPLKAGEYEVEIECQRFLNFSDISLADSEKASIYTTNDKTFFTGYVECIEDSVLFLRFSEALIMFEIDPKVDFSSFLNHYVKIRIHELHLYDIF